MKQGRGRTEKEYKEIKGGGKGELQRKVAGSSLEQEAKHRSEEASLTMEGYQREEGEGTRRERESCSLGVH